MQITLHKCEIPLLCQCIHLVLVISYSTLEINRGYKKHASLINIFLNESWCSPLHFKCVPQPSQINISW